MSWSLVMFAKDQAFSARGFAFAGMTAPRMTPRPDGELAANYAERELCPPMICYIKETNAGTILMHHAFRFRTIRLGA